MEERPFRAAYEFKCPWALAPVDVVISRQSCSLPRKNNHRRLKPD